MRRRWPAAVAGLGLVAMLLAAPPVQATGNPPGPCASPSPAPSPSPTPIASGSRTNVAPPPSPGPCADPTLQQAQQQLGAELADALAQEQQVAAALQLNAAEQQRLLSDIVAGQARLEELDQQISDLDSQIADKTQQVEAEKAQLAVLAKALYAQPSGASLPRLHSHALGESESAVTRVLLPLARGAVGDASVLRY